MEIIEVIDRIIKLNSGLKKFWSDSEGWAPIEAAELLSRSRLDRQISLSHCLKNYIVNPYDESSDGHLILGWANLGSLVEGTMKLFLSAYYKTYKDDADVIIMRKEIVNPDVLMLEKLRQFFKRKIWDNDWDEFVHNIQIKRNAIHAFKDREIGDYSEFGNNIRQYLEMLRYINSRLPYPDDIYIPREI
ncbi:hypothetical protein ACFLS9_08170 [Bacteroidota bacterium]